MPAELEKAVNLEQAVKELQDTTIVIAEIERRQSALIDQHEQSITDLYKVSTAHNKMLNAMSQAALSQIENTIGNNETIARLSKESAEFRRRTDQNLAEITDKLNGLIGYVSGLQRPSQ